MSYLRSGLGDTSVCGVNPCGFFDLLPFPGLFTSNQCAAFMACMASDGSLTPTPAQEADNSLLSTINGSSSSSSASSSSAGAPDAQTMQNQCQAAGGSWNPFTGKCDGEYLPWIFGGAAVLLLALFLGRR